LPADRLAGAPDPLYVCVPTDAPVPADWPEWVLWYTDGEAVAVFCHKWWPNRAHDPQPDDPWF